MGKLANLNDPERWEWHAYDYGFRRVVWGDFNPISPIDRDGEWFNAALADAAEDYFRQRFSRLRPIPLAIPSAHTVRANWRKIPYPQLTEAERAIAEPEMREMARRARESIAMAVTKGRANGS